MQYIRYFSEKQIAFITLNNDSKSNALNRQMLDEVEEAINRAQEEKMRVIIVRSNPGAKVWCAGLRIDQLPNPEKDAVPYEYSLEKMLRHFETFPGVVIGMIEGSVWGGGCELAFSCDLLIGTAAAGFAITPARIGAPYNPNQVNRVLQRVGSNMAMEMFFTAEMISAERARELGILNHVVPSDNLEEFTMNMARKITRNAPLAIRLIKQHVHQLAYKTVEQLTQDSANRDFIRRVFYSRDFVEGKQAFLEKRVPHFTCE